MCAIEKFSLMGFPMSERVAEAMGLDPWHFRHCNGVPCCSMLGTTYHTTPKDQKVMGLLLFL